VAFIILNSYLYLRSRRRKGNKTMTYIFSYFNAIRKKLYVNLALFLHVLQNGINFFLQKLQCTVFLVGREGEEGFLLPIYDSAT
jgi:hypothetical protein